MDRGSRRPAPVGVTITTVGQLRTVWPDLRDATLVGLDLREESFDWTAALVSRTALLGCRLPTGVVERLTDAGVGVMHAPAGLPFEPFRKHLYSYEELAAGQPTRLDERIAAWFAASSMDVRDEVVRSLHDATLTAAVARFVTGRRMVGVMGGHALSRDDELYRRIAVLGRTLTRAGYTIATGGGPGAMEAANLGAWLAPSPTEDLDAALDILAAAPTQDAGGDAYVAAALEVRHRWPTAQHRVGESLGVPTFLYIDEATTGFATHIAKFFAYSIREDGLLALARSGVVYAPGSAGTEQELFSDGAQNSYTMYEVRSPMVLFGSDYYERTRPDLLAALRHQAAAYGWEHLLSVHDDPAAVLAFVNAHDPDAAGTATIQRRRSYPDTSPRSQTR
jgi:predicted Rossmann-fold nucleotide-binding protein